MYIVEKTLDDVLLRVIRKLLKTKNRVYPTRGAASEYTGALLKIKKPRARLSRTEKKGTLFSCLGEFLWYLSGKNDLDYITYYISRYQEESSDGKTVYGAYGPRLFNKNGINQIQSILELLRQKPSSRRAVIQLFDAGDLTSGAREIPCTCSLQFLIRDGYLHMITNMRSNDAFLGLPHDVFAFTMLQEIFARSLEVKLGTYNHAVGSLHLYDKDRKNAEKFVDEGWQRTILMPPMPKGDPWSSINLVLEAENKIRNGSEINADELGISPYWTDLVRISQIFSYEKKNKINMIESLKTQMSTEIYDSYIEKRTQKRRNKAK